MRFKRCMFLTLMLFLTIFSISFVCASENLTYDQSEGELSSLSDSNPTDASNLNVDFIDESNDDSLDETSENESDDCLVYNENQLLRSSNNVEILSNGKNFKLGAGNTLNVLGASIDEPVLGSSIYWFNPNSPQRDYTTENVMAAIVECSRTGGGTVYLYGQTYNGAYTLTAPENTLETISNVRVVGGSPDNPDQIATFNVDLTQTAMAFVGTQHQKYYSGSGYNLVDVTFENLKSTGRLFSFCSGSLTNVVFNNLESREHLFFLYGCYDDSKPITLTNCNFTNCHQTYLGDNDINDGCGQLGAIFGGKLVGCNFINTSSANHGGAFCLSDEYENGPEHVASTLTDCNFINVTSRWFAVYIHGNYTDDSAHGGSTYIKDPQVLDNCKFINCKSTAEYGGALGISHNNVIIKNSEFINNTGGEGAAIMVGGIEYGHDAFWGKNTEGNNMTIENCKFINNVARTQGQNPTYVPNLTKTIYPTGNAGAVYVYGNNTKIFNTLFENNTASDDGAAIYIHGWHTVVENTTLRNNSAVDGTIYIEGSNTTIINSTYVNNTATNGAGVYIIGANANITDSKFYDNYATNSGGAAYVNGANTTITNAEVNRNQAPAGYGGGFYVIGDDCTVTNLTADYNSALIGGAISVQGHDATFTNVSSLNNTAAQMGGSIFVQGENTLFENGNYSYNTAPIGGAISIVGSDTTFINNNVTYNKAEPSSFWDINCDGGAIAIQGSNTNFTSNNISYNSARDNGGGVYVDGSNTYFDDIYADNNKALNGGFAQLEGATDLIVKNSIFTNNHAIGDINRTQGCGGAFHISGSDNADIQGNFYNNTAINGSAIYVEHSTLRIHDSEFYENLAYTWLLAIQPENLTNFKEIDDVIVKITHIGGDNIANAIHDFNRSSNITVNNISYPFYHNGKESIMRTNASDMKPVYGYEKSENGTLIYEDEKENNQGIYYTIRNTLTNEIIDNDTIITDIDGTISINLTGKLPVGFYEVNGTYFGSRYYTAALNFTALFGMEGLNLTINKTVDKPSVYVNDEVVFTINVTNNGPFNATHVNVTDIVPIQFKVTGFNDTNYNNKTGLLVIDQLNVGDSYQFTITAVALVAGNWTNVASAVCDQNDTVVQDDATVEVLPLGTVDVTKLWNDGNNALNTRPAFITVELFGDGISVANATLNAGNNWYWSFGNLPVVNGTKRIKYTISEVTVPNYVVNVTENPAGVFVIENTLLTSVNVTKVWNDGDNALNTRPASIFVELFGDGVSVANATLNANNNWYWSFANLTVFNGNNRIKYTISEVTVPNYVVNVTEADGVFTIENTLVTSVNVTKVWNDGNNADNTRPAYIFVELFGDNVKVGQATLNANNNWYWSFANLTVFNGNDKIKYTISEVTVPNYVVNVTEADGVFTIENTLVTSVNVTKVWNDGNNADNTRPAYIFVELFGDNVKVGQATLNANNNWYWSFANLTVFNGNDKIKYTISEVTVPNYVVNVTEADGVFTIENTLVTSVNVTKVWNDGNNADNTRPAYIIVELFGDNVKVGQATLNANNNWYWSFPNLTVFNGNNRIKYTISEITVPGYETVVTNSTPYNWTVTNTELVNLTVKKVWNDKKNQDGVRPINVTVKLFADLKNVGETTLNSTNNWTYTFENLHKFSDNGKLINYTVNETEVVNYTAIITRDNNNFLINNTHVTELVNLTVKKVWVDNGNKDGVRPVYVIVELLRNGTVINSTVLSAANNWTYTFLNLDKYANGRLINYTVNETRFDNYTASYSYDGMGNWTVTNTHITELVNVTVKKVWTDNGNQDGVRPVYVIVELLRNGTVINSTVLSAANNWTYTFLNLDKYANGRLINYTVNETRFDNYTASYSYDGMGNWTVTNTHITELVNVTVKKVWTDKGNQDGVRPVSVTVLLFADDVNIRNATLSASNNWTYTFEGLDKFKNNASLIVYRINETEVVNYTANITDDGNGNWIINNTHVTELVNVTVKKVWTDKGNQDGVRPVSVTVLLFADDVNIRNATLSASNNWTYTFEGLDKFKNNASLIVYRVNETEVVNYTVNITGDNGSFVINNTHITEVVNVTVVKVWNDGNNASGKRPANITVVLLADGKIIRNATLRASNGWTFTFEGLDKYKNNRTLIKYSIGEINVGVPGYTTKITNSTPYNWTVNNTYVPKINKTANVTHVFYHEFVLYNITITNMGTGIYNETLTIVDSLPYGLDYIRTVNITGARVIQDAVYDEDANNVTWVITDINPDTPAIIFVLVGTYDIGNLTNNVTLIGPNGFKDIVNCTIEVEPIVDLSVNKTVDFAAHYLGDIVVWTIKVSNAFNGTNATDVTLRDILPAEFSLVNYTATKGNYTDGIWHIGFMGNGTEETLVINSRAINAVPSVTNYANVSCNETEWNYTNNADNATTSVVVLPPPHKVVNNTKPFYHDTIAYNLTVINDGNYTFKDNIIVYDILPDGLEYLDTIRITGADVVVNATVNSKNNISWVIKNIDAHSTAVIEVLVKVNAVGKLINNETIVFTDGSNMTVNCTIVAQPIVDVAVNKTVDNEFHFLGDIVVWTIKVSNAFNGTNATDVTLKDILPAEFSLINSTATRGSYADGVWYIGFMGNGTEETLVINSRAKAVGTFINIANVTCNETDWDEDNNVDNATTSVVVLPPPHKVVNNTKPFYHENVRYNLTVVNDGDYDYTQNVIVYDILPDGLEFLKTIRVIDADVVVDTTVNSKNNISWVIKNIKAHSTAIIEVLVKVNAVGNLTNNETIVYPDGSNMTVNCTIDAQPIVDVAVEKTVDKELHFVGDIVVWTIKVSNAYNGTNATNVVMNDLLPAEFEFISSTATRGKYTDGVWYIGFMGNGTEETLVINSRAKAVGTFINIANVTCNETDWDEDNNVDNATVTVLKNPGIGKTVNNTKPYHFEFVEYYLTITNTEVIDYTNNLVVIDSLPDGLVYVETLRIEGATLVNRVVDGQIIKWNITGVKAKSSAVITVKVLANATGDLTNNGTLVPAYGNNVTVNCTITPIPIADLEVIKLSDNSRYNTNAYYKGDTVTWTIIVINNGPDDAINAVATDFLPSGLIYVSDDSQGAFDHNTGIWKIGNLSSGNSVTLNIVTNISITNARITNNVDVTSETYDPNETNNHDKNTINVEPEADLGIVKLVSQVTSRYNDIVTWTIIVVNNGPDTAVGAVVSDKLPSGVVYLSDDSHGAYNHKTGVWKLGNLAKGQFKVLNIKTKVRTTNKTITNFANVTSKTYDPDTTNNKCNNSTTVDPIADLMLIKDVDKDTVRVGDKVKFTIVVKNLGPDTAVNTRAYDILPSGLKFISYEASMGTYNNNTGKWDIGDLEPGETVELTIIAEALVVGKVVNEAHVESDTYDNDTSNNYDNATVTVVGPPTLLQLYPTGNPFAMMLLALFAIVVVNIRKRN